MSTELIRELTAVLVGLAANDFIDVVVDELKIENRIVSKVLHFGFVMLIAIVLYITLLHPSTHKKAKE